jgi:MFS family permease
MVGLGFLIGAGTGGFLVSFGYAVPSYVALVIQVLTLLFVATAVKEPAKLSESKKSDTSSKSKDATFLGTLKALATNADTQSVFFYHILIMVSFVGVQHAYLEYIRDNLVRLPINSADRPTSKEPLPPIESGARNPFHLPNLSWIAHGRRAIQRQFLHSFVWR